MSALIIQKLRGKIRNRQPFTTSKGNPFLIGYLTPGGTYILATNGQQSDDGYPRDLLAILPGDAGQGQVLKLYIAVNSRLIDEVTEIMARKS